MTPLQRQAAESTTLGYPGHRVDAYLAMAGLPPRGAPIALKAIEAGRRSAGRVARAALDEYF